MVHNLVVRRTPGKQCAERKTATLVKRLLRYRPSTPPISRQLAVLDSLPTSREGRPKPAPAWIAGAFYYIASQHVFASLAGLSMYEVGTGLEKTAQFRVEVSYKW